MNKPIIYSGLDSSKLLKFFPKHIHSASFNINNASNIKTSYRQVRTLKKCKTWSHITITNHLSTSLEPLFKTLMKNHRRSINKLSPHTIESTFAKYTRSLKQYELYINEFSDWKNLRNLSKIKTVKVLDSAVFDCMDVFDFDEQLIARQQRQKEVSLKRYLKSNNKLETLIYRGNLNNEIYRYFSIIEKNLPKLKNFENANLMIFSFGSKDALVSEDFSYLFAKIKALRIMKTNGNNLPELLFKNPLALSNLSKLSIDINCSERQFDFLGHLESLPCLKILQIIVYGSGKSMFDAFLSSLTLPKKLSEFIFHIHNLKLSSLLIPPPEETTAFDETTFESLEPFKHFLTNISKAEALKTLELKLFSNEFKEYYTSFFSSICTSFKKLEWIRFKVIEPSYNIQRINLPEPFRLDFFLEKLGNLLRNLRGLVVTAPKLTLKYVSDDMVNLKNLQELNLGNRIEDSEQCDAITKLLNKIKPSADFSFGFGKEVIKDEKMLKDRFESIVNIPKIEHVGYAFKSELEEDAVWNIIGTFASRMRKGALKFSLMSVMRHRQARKHFLEALTNDGKEYTLYDRGSERYICWAPIKSKP